MLYNCKTPKNSFNKGKENKSWGQVKQCYLFVWMTLLIVLLDIHLWAEASVSDEWILIESKQLQPPLSLIITGGQWKGTKFLRISGRMPPKQKPVVIWSIDKEERNRAAASFLFREGGVHLAVLAGTNSCSPESAYRATQRGSWDGYTRVLQGLARRHVWWTCS